MANFFIITNNELVRDKFAAEQMVEFHEEAHIPLLERVRDYVHLGHKLLTHPLAGSIKPNETPYKTVLLTKAKGPLDGDSVRIIEESIATCLKFNKPKFVVIPQDMRQDFRTIDCSLAENALASAVLQ